MTRESGMLDKTAEVLLPHVCTGQFRIHDDDAGLIFVGPIAKSDHRCSTTLD